MKYRRAIILILGVALTPGCVGPTWQETQVSEWQHQVRSNPDAREQKRLWTYRNWRVTEEEEMRIGLGIAAAVAVAVTGGVLLVR